MDFSFLNDITNTKQAWVYLAFSLLGLYSSIFFTTVEEKRFPKWWDLYLLTGSLPFVWGAALLADMTPWVSLVIGVASERAYSAIRKKGLNFSFGADKGLTFGSEDDDDDEDDEPKAKKLKVVPPPEPDVVGKPVRTGKPRPTVPPDKVVKSDIIEKNEIVQISVTSDNSSVEPVSNEAEGAD